MALHPPSAQANQPGQPNYNQLATAGHASAATLQSTNHPLGSIVIAATGFYIGLVIVTVYLASGWLYNWAHDRILNSSGLPLAQQLNQFDDVQTIPSATDEGNVSLVAANPDDQTSASSRSAVTTLPPINVLVMGTDARPEDTDPARTDTMILLSLNPQNQSLGILSLPRDLWVPIANQNLTTKINLAYVIGEERNYPGGGAQLAMDTVSGFIGQPVDYYVRLNFSGFIELIDLIGGIDIAIPHTIHDEAYPTADFGVETFHLDSGPQHLDGEVALKYVRVRNIDDDYGRARRQQQVIRGIADKVLSAEMIPTLLPKIPTIFYTMRSSIDTNIPMARQLELAQFASNTSVENIRQIVLDKRYGEETFSEEGAWILLPDRTLVKSALDRFFAPTTSSDGIAAANGEASWVRIEVLNGTGQPLVASRTRDLLEAKGWKVITVDDADRSDYDHTIIINYGVSPTVIDQLGNDMELPSSPSSLSLSSIKTASTALVDLRIVVGKDYLAQLPSQ